MRLHLSDIQNPKTCVYVIYWQPIIVIFTRPFIYEPRSAKARSSSVSAHPDLVLHSSLISCKNNSESSIHFDTKHEYDERFLFNVYNNYVKECFPLAPDCITHESNARRNTVESDILFK